MSATGKKDPHDRRSTTQEHEQNQPTYKSTTAVAAALPQPLPSPILQPSSTTTIPESSQPRQVIAVSASKNPAAFFNLARRFLVTDELCDLSALEGAIVSAVDAAHLLERSKLANIIRIQTSYVTVEPRRKSSHPIAKDDISHQQQQQSQRPMLVVSDPSAAAHAPIQHLHPQKPPPLRQQQYQQISHQPKQPPTVPHTEKKTQGKKGNPLRRSRIIITVKRTEDYRRWLEENDVDDDNNPPTTLS